MLLNSGKTYRTVIHLSIRCITWKFNASGEMEAMNSFVAIIEFDDAVITWLYVHCSLDCWACPDTALCRFLLLLFPKVKASPSCSIRSSFSFHLANIWYAFWQLEEQQEAWTTSLNPQLFERFLNCWTYVRSFAIAKDVLSSIFFFVIRDCILLELVITLFPSTLGFSEGDTFFVFRYCTQTIKIQTICLIWEYQ